MNFIQNISDFIRDKPWIFAIVLFIVLAACYMSYKKSVAVPASEPFSSGQSNTGSTIRKATDDKFSPTRQ